MYIPGMKGETVDGDAGNGDEKAEEVFQSHFPKRLLNLIGVHFSGSGCRIGMTFPLDEYQVEG